MRLENPGLVRPASAIPATTCAFRHVELDETVLDLLGPNTSSVLFQADSVGLGSKSFEALCRLRGVTHSVVSRDIRDGHDIREPMPTKWDVVYAMNVMLYLPATEHKAVVATIASYNLKYLCITHVDHEVLLAHYNPVWDNADRIVQNMRHKDLTEWGGKCLLWARK